MMAVEIVTLFAGAGGGILGGTCLAGDTTMDDIRRVADAALMGETYAD